MFAAGPDAIAQANESRGNDKARLLATVSHQSMVSAHVGSFAEAKLTEPMLELYNPVGVLEVPSPDKALS